MKGTELFSLFSYISLVWFSLLHGAKCETYTVGDEEGWTAGVNYHTWSTEYDFKVNGTLGSGSCFIFLLTCRPVFGLLKIYKAKEYWFICNIAGHCQGGMRFLVNLTDASKASPSRGTGITPLPSSNNSSAFKPVPSLIYYFFALGIFLQLLFCYIEREKKMNGNTEKIELLR